MIGSWNKACFMQNPDLSSDLFSDTVHEYKRVHCQIPEYAEYAEKCICNQPLMHFITNRIS